jgi:hypothetical protein
VKPIQGIGELKLNLFYNLNTSLTFKYNIMSTPPKSDSNFQKKTKSKLVANLHRKLDDFIQNSLDKYHFVDVSQKMLDVASVYSRHIVSNKSAIPDLVIYNKKFNKNDCFVDTNQDIYLPFPRYIKFLH